MVKDISEIKKEDFLDSCQMVKEFPFKIDFTLKYLIDVWENTIAGEDHPAKIVYDAFLKEAIEANPWLKEPISDLSLLKKHKKIIDALTLILFPHGDREANIWACYLPFKTDHFYASPRFDQIVSTVKDEYKEMAHSHKKLCHMIIKAYTMILEKFYGLHIPLEYSAIFPFLDNENQLQRYFKLGFDLSYLEIECVKELPVLSEEDLKIINRNLTKPDILMKYLSPDCFTFRGFSIMKGVDVTDQELMSGIKNDLLKKDSILSPDSFSAIQDKVRSLMGMAELVMEIAVVNRNQIYILNKSDRVEERCKYFESKSFEPEFIKGSVFERALQHEDLFLPLVIDDLEDIDTTAPLDEKLLKSGVRNLLVARLVYENQIIGSFMLYSDKPGQINTLNSMKIIDVYPLIAMAVKRSLDEFENRIESIIQDKFTAIHPTVLWRFRKAAFGLLTNQMRNKGGGSEIEKIVFEDVYPLYCASDIRGSSTFRNAAIQEDLGDHLQMARKIVIASCAHKNLPVLDELLFRIDKYMEDLADGLASGDEIGIINFLHRDVEPSFRDLSRFGEDVKQLIDDYNKTLDPEIGTLYRKRREFDDSVGLVNHTIAAYLERIQVQAQEMFPHYFDKSTTDGVDQNIYIGASLVENHTFDKLYLRNLRLWQLLVLCKIARLAEELKPRLSVPLETTHLIVVQEMPITISFKVDEKRFAVEGAYNIRYEIMKKRIDKAIVSKTGERLTQIRKVAIVYTQVSEALEYRQFIEYLADKGYLENEVEDLLLEDLQGIKGLRALRVGIKLDSEWSDEDILSVIEEAGSFNSQTVK